MIRIIIASSQTDMMRAVGNELARLPCAETVSRVMRVADAEHKISAICSHLLLVDLDSVTDLFRLQQIKNRHQLYVICVSGNASYATTSLRSGGDEFVLKPAISTPVSTMKFIENIVKHVNAYAQRQKTPAMRELNKMVSKHDKQKIVAIASSTGGTSALEVLLAGLPADIPPIVAVQHMTSGFTKLFAERLNANNKQQIREASTGDYLMRGTLLLAPADRHMKLVRREGRLAVECFVGQKLHGVMPAADILFESVAELVKGDAVGVVLTGMGADGARGLKAMRAAGAKTIGQDEATCVVYGMPKVAKDLGAITYELPLDKIAERIMALARE
ncbi:MAG: CheB methylesterase domain-containing protein [Defluviitaleaceae bacterium]|nr:CheB methylesterase domain-containing protein [Defluviitaleaceae bacterium]